MVHRSGQHGDAAGDGLAIALWASIEAQVGIIAACILCVRAVFLRFLSRIGIYNESASRADREGSSAWRSQGRRDANLKYSRPARFHTKSADRDGLGGWQTSTEIVASQSEEEILPSGSGHEELPGQVEYKIQMDEYRAKMGIELSSMK
ncbi:hypothetical protein C8A00DRAFT_31678, partial [Chaetomidium leptoderma]